jgi:hypothetical protein
MVKLYTYLKQHRITLLCAVFFININTYAVSDTIFIPQKQFFISATPLFYEPLKIEHFGEPLLKSGPSSSISICLGHKALLNKKNYLKIGVGASLMTYYFSFDFDAQTTHKGINATHHELHAKEFAWYHYMIPLSLTHELAFKNNRRFYVEAGTTFIVISEFHGSTGMSYSLDGGNRAKIFNIYTTNYYMKQKRFLSYQLKLGMEKITKRVHSWSYALVFSYNPKSVARGTYSFTYMPFESSGNIEQRISYIGIELTFGLSFFKTIRIEN